MLLFSDASRRVSGGLGDLDQLAQVFEGDHADQAGLARFLTDDQDRLQRAALKMTQDRFERHVGGHRLGLAIHHLEDCALAAVGGGERRQQRTAVQEPGDSPPRIDDWKVLLMAGEQQLGRRPSGSCGAIVS